MEEQLVERTIKLLAGNLRGVMATNWEKQHIAMTNIDDAYQELAMPEFVEEDFYRFSLDERISSKDYRFVVGCQRSVQDTTQRADVLEIYTLDILYIHDFKFDNQSRYYIPMRVRNSVIALIGSHYRNITGRSSNIVLKDIAMAEEAAKGSRSVLTGVSYDIVA